MDKKKTLNTINRWCGFIVTAPAAVLLIWELSVRMSFINPVYFPAPTTIAQRFVYLLFKDHLFLSDLFFSLKRLALGAVIAIPSAIIFGLALSLNKKIARFMNPLVSLTYPIPKLSILPLLMIIFGIGDGSKIALIAIGIFYLILLSVSHGIKSLPQPYFDIVFVYKIPLLKKLCTVILKGILPDILNGCKMGIGYGLVMVVASEFIAAKNGIGFFMWNAWDQFRIEDMYVGLAVFSLLGLGVFFFFDWLLSKIKWKYNNRSW
jgi:ABC-type nitrate/sulfonate/bicarbonate transport system permease component